MARPCTLPQAATNEEGMAWRECEAADSHNPPTPDPGFTVSPVYVLLPWSDVDVAPATANTRIIDAWRLGSTRFGLLSATSPYGVGKGAGKEPSALPYTGTNPPLPLSRASWLAARLPLPLPPSAALLPPPEAAAMWLKSLEFGLGAGRVL